MNFFSSDVFLESLAEAFFPKKRASLEWCRCDGAVYRLLVIEGQRVITDWPFLDLLEPVEDVPPGARVRTVGFLPRVLRGLQPVEEWRAAPAPGLDICPRVDWSLFPTWEDYEAAGPRCSRSGASQRNLKLLARRLGPLSFLPEDPRPETLAEGLRWKSAQYRASGVPDPLRQPRHVAFYQALHRRGALAVSSLSAGGRLVAVHIGMLHEGRRYSWLPAYDRALKEAAPGRILLESLLEHGYRSREAEFDFLIGDEPYKLRYATHVRRVGPVGQEPLARWVEQEARRRVRHALRQAPWLHGHVRELRQRLVDRFLST